MRASSTRSLPRCSVCCASSRTSSADGSRGAGHDGQRRAGRDADPAHRLCPRRGVRLLVERLGHLVDHRAELLDRAPLPVLRLRGEGLLGPVEELARLRGRPALGGRSHLLQGVQHALGRRGLREVLQLGERHALHGAPQGGHLGPAELPREARGALRPLARLVIRILLRARAMPLEFPLQPQPPNYLFDI